MRIPALLCVAWVVLLFGCQDERGGSGGRGDPTGPPESPEIGGFYRVTQTHGSPACSAPLPPPPLPDEDPDDYVRIGPFTIESVVEIQQGGRTVSWVVLEFDGKPPSEVPLLGRSLNGTLDEENRLDLATLLEYREPAREDSVRYLVTWDLDSSTSFEERAGTMELSGTGTSTFTYRTGPGGEVVTTCTVQMSSTGVRDSVPEEPAG